MSGVIRLQNILLRRILPHLKKRNISTSKKNSDTVDITATSTNTKASTSKNWISYGFEKTAEAEDRTTMHTLFFASVTMCLVFGGFYMGYKPDYNLRDWAQREAFLELRRREEAGIPLIDPNFIDPAKIVLPSDEELEDTEIII